MEIFTAINRPTLCLPKSDNENVNVYFGVSLWFISFFSKSIFILFKKYIIYLFGRVRSQLWLCGGLHCSAQASAMVRRLNCSATEWDHSFLTRNQIPITCITNRLLTTLSPGKTPEVYFCHSLGGTLLLAAFLDHPGPSDLPIPVLPLSLSLRLQPWLFSSAWFLLICTHGYS